MPNGAESRKARNPERRQIPKGARCQTAPNGGAVPLFVALRDFAQSGIPRCLGFRAVRDSAPFGIWRRSAFGAVWDFAPVLLPCVHLGAR
jgi:hypothetical protein